MDKTVLALMSSLSKRAVEYLADEAELEATKVEFNLRSIDQITLRPLTSLVALGGGMSIYIAFSFDEPVINAIQEAYTSDLDVDADQKPLYMEVTAEDLINLVTGNALKEVAEPGSPITMTPPLFINEAKQIGRADNAKIYMGTITFPEGGMNIICIGPPHLFDDQLNYKES